jgi:hypothetical protein
MLQITIETATRSKRSRTMVSSLSLINGAISPTLLDEPFAVGR